MSVNQVMVRRTDAAYLVVRDLGVCRVDSMGKAMSVHVRGKTRGRQKNLHRGFRYTITTRFALMNGFGSLEEAPGTSKDLTFS